MNTDGLTNPPAAGESSIVISLDDACLDDPQCVEDVLAALAERGFTLSKRLINIGILCGRIQSDQISALENIPHVQSVDLDSKRYTV
ncbi:MAG: hypothetical protein O7B26_09035 [Planctomycetota bacterium]|nr:hypothetical protein [Planctomycetota bacterium]